MRSRRQLNPIGTTSLMSILHMKNCIESISDKIKEIRALTLHFYTDFFPLNNDQTRSRFVLLKERVSRLKAEILAIGSVMDPEPLLPNSYDLNVLMTKINGKLFRISKEKFQMMKTISGETFILLFETMNVFMHFQKPGESQSMSPVLVDIVLTSPIDGRNFFSVPKNNNNANNNGIALINPQMRSNLVEVDGRLVNEGLKRRAERGCGVAVAESLVWQRITWFVKKIYLFQIKCVQVDIEVIALNLIEPFSRLFQGPMKKCGTCKKGMLFEGDRFGFMPCTGLRMGEFYHERCMNL